MTKRATVTLMLGLLSALIATQSLAAEEKADDFSWIRGANYVPSYARNDVQTWMDYDPKVIDRELGYAARLKLNSVRVFLQYAVYKNNPKLFLERYENFLSLCKKHDIRAMIVVFDSCFGDYPDLKNYRRKNWMSNPGQNMLGGEYWPELEKYVQDVVGAYRNDKRIVMWDVMNEPMCTRHAGKAEGREKIWKFLNHFLDVVKKKDPTHPRTVGFMNSRFVARVIDKIEVIGWHNYTGDMNALRADIRRVKQLGAKHSKPVHINEIARRNTGQHFWKFMPVLRKEKIGWYFWELMLGSTQFSRGTEPIQGVIYPDGTCRDGREIAFIMDVKAEQALKLFPRRKPPEVTDGGTIYRGFWTRWTGKGPRGGYLFYANTAGSEAERKFAGAQIDLVHKVGPDCGIAEVILDGKTVKEIDTYCPKVDWNRATVLVSGLKGDDAAGTVKIKVTGRKNPKSRNSYVQIVGFEAK